MTSRRTGLTISPFRALRYADGADQPALADLLCPPYDVISPDLRARLAESNPHNAVHVVLPAGPAEGPGNRYERAAADLSAWQADGTLVRDAEPGLYGYEMSGYELSDGESRTRGLLALVDLHPPEDDVILPHESTMAGPVADRLALMEATHADLEPIYLVYAGSGTLAAELDRLTADPASALVADAVTDDGIRHRVWRITDADAIAAAADELATRRAVIADGHHRYATYLEYQAARHDAGAGAGGWDRGLALLVDATSSGPHVEATHRVIPGLPLVEAVDRLRGVAAITPVDAGTEPLLAALRRQGAAGTAFALTDGTTAYLLTNLDTAAMDAAVPADHSAAWRSLDVTVAHHFLIRDRWGLRDHEDIVGFEHDLGAAIRAAAGGTVLALNPTPVAAVAEVADAGDRMPRKSTLFTPKPRTGLVFRPIDQ
ncbi:MAG: DUF1015 family protein [Mycobacteriales bacterium]